MSTPATYADLPESVTDSLARNGDVVEVWARNGSERANDTIAELRAVSDDETWVDNGDETVGIEFTGEVDGQEWCVHVLWR